MIQLGFGDTLVRYADGVTEAPDVQEELFDEERLLGTVQANIGRSAQAIQDALITEIDKSVGGVPQFDDITLKILVRGSNDL